MKKFFAILSTLFAICSPASASFAGDSGTKTEAKPSERDHDLTQVLTNEIYGLVKCEYPSQKSVEKWLSENPTAIIDKKEFPSTSFDFKGDKSYCFSSIVLHYHLQK